MCSREQAAERTKKEEQERKVRVFCSYLEIVERAYTNKNHGGFIDRLRSRTGQKPVPITQSSNAIASLPV